MTRPTKDHLIKAIADWKDQLNCIEKMLIADMEDNPELYNDFSKHDFDDVIYAELQNMGPG